MKAVIMAAGYGTRFLPITKTIAKEMLPIVDKPAIHFIVEELIQAGITDILIISHRKKKSLEDYFDKDPELEGYFKAHHKLEQLEFIQPPQANIVFVRQQEMRGSGDALLLAESFVGSEPFILAYPDDVVLGDVSLSKQLLDIYQAQKKSILACENIDGDVSRFGVIKPGEKLDENLVKTQCIIEKPPIGKEPSRTISIGRYLLTPEIFSVLKECYKSHKSGEFILTDGLQILAQNGNLLSYVYQGKRLDIGEPISYIRSLLYVIGKSEKYSYLLDEVQK